MKFENRRSIRTILVAASMLVVSLIQASATRADAVTDWNAIAGSVTVAAGRNPIQTSRIMAMTQLAVHDALNAIDRQYEPYALRAMGDPHASPEAAVATAAYLVLLSENPSQQGALDVAYVTALAGIPDGPDKTNGILAGRSAALAMIALRALDNSSANPQYTPGDRPGDWLPIPAGTAPVLPGWGRVTTFALIGGDQFRPNRPIGLVLTSREYLRDFNEVKAIGKNNSTTRTTDQTQIAQFWVPNVIITWNGVARRVGADRGFDLWENARLFALANMAIADTVIAVWDGKFHFNFWRPQTAIQLGDTDGNPRTGADPNWVSLLANPSYPDYPSGHSGIDGAAATVLAFFYGDNNAFSISNGAITRNYTSFSQAAQEAADSRVYGGIHFRTACEDSLRLGERVADFALVRFLRQVPGRTTRVPKS